MRLLADTLDALHKERGVTHLIAGDARGADFLALQWAKSAGIPRDRFAADWDAHGRAAGPLRNQRMLDEGKPDLVLAFPGGKGTADMVRRAEEAGVPVRKVAAREDTMTQV